MSRVQEIIDYVDGGVAKSVGELCIELLGIEEDDLTQEELEEIDDAIFTCEQCDWTMPKDDSVELDTGSVVCTECSES